MSKKEFLEILEKELQRLENEEHVSQLANNGRYAEVDVVVSEIDYTALANYMNNGDEMEELAVADIPEGYVLTFAIYLSGSEYDECDVMESWEDLRDALYECGDAGEAIADTLNYDAINDFNTFEGLVLGEDADEDEVADQDEAEDEDEDSDDDGDDEETDEDDEESAE